MRIDLQVGFKVTRSFFDRPAVMRAMEKATRRALMRSGAYVRIAAKRSMRKRKGASEPGQPPHAHVGLLKRFIFYAYEAAIKDVVVGPIAFRSPYGSTTVPELLERGGTVTIRRKSKHKKKKSMRIRYPARPFMGPALERSRPRIAQFWRDSLTN